MLTSYDENRPSFCLALCTCFWNTIQKDQDHKISFLTNKEKANAVFTAATSVSLTHYKANADFTHEGRYKQAGISNRSLLRANLTRPSTATPKCFYQLWCLWPVMKLAAAETLNYYNMIIHGIFLAWVCLHICVDFLHVSISTTPLSYTPNILSHDWYTIPLEQ